MDKKDEEVKEGKKMAVSKAVLKCVEGKAAKEILEGMEKSSLNTDIIYSCQDLIFKLLDKNKDKKNKK